MGEVKCMELEEVLEEQGYSEADIEEKVSAYRKMLLSKEVSKKAFAETDEFGRPILKETHQIAEAQKEKNSKLRDAFGIGSSFIEGSSFDPNRREKEAAIREEERDRQREERIGKQRRKRKESSSNSSSSEDIEEERRKRKSKKKSRKISRSESRENYRIEDKNRKDSGRDRPDRGDDRDTSERRFQKESRHEEVQIKEERDSSVPVEKVQWETNKRYQLDVKEEPNSPPARK